MKRFGYILLLLVSLGILCFAPKSEPTIMPIPSADCTIQQCDHVTLVGLQGEPLTIAGSAHTHISAPTHFSYSAHRVSFGKNRTRTAFLRKMIHHHPPFYFIFQGKERREASPFCACVGSAYYVYALRHILC